jgi:hypothetical protein
VKKVKLGKHKAHVIYRTKDGSRVPGATTVSGYGEDVGGLIHSAWKLGTEGTNYKSEWAKAAEAGTVGHFLIACHFKCVEADLSEYSPEVVDLGENVFLKFLEDFQREGLTCVHSEKVYVSEEMRVGGTLDVVARDKEGRLVLIDEKSSKDIYPPYISQLSGYRLIYDENEEEKLQRFAIFRNGKREKGDTELRWIQPETMDRHAEVFRAQVKLYYAWKLTKQ